MSTEQLSVSLLQFELTQSMPAIPPTKSDITHKSVSPKDGSSDCNDPSAVIGAISSSPSSLSSPASDLSDVDFDFSASHADFFNALFPVPELAPAVTLPSSVEVRTGLVPIVPASLKTALPPQQTSSSVRSTTASDKPRKRNADSTLMDKDAKTRERILRNRTAAQESRDKKRRYIADLEDVNAELQSENVHLTKRLKATEEQNNLLSARLEALSAQITQIQQQFGLVPVTQQPLFDGFRDPAAVTNMVDPTIVGNASNDNRGNDDRHDDVAFTFKGLASSQQRKPSIQQRIMLQKPVSFPPILLKRSLLRSPHQRRRYLTSKTLNSTSHLAKSIPKISWQSAVWMTLSILFWITTESWPLNPLTAKAGPILSGLNSCHSLTRSQFIERILTSLSDIDLHRLKMTSLRNATHLHYLYKSYLKRIMRADWPP